MSEERRFDRAETTRILSRAVEMRAQLPERLRAVPADGITLDQLTAAAEEAGLDPMSVRAAAAELDAPFALKVSPWFGSPIRLVEERVIARSVDPVEFDLFVDEVRRVLGTAGVASITARAVTWSSVTPGAAAAQDRRISISLVVREESTTLRLEEDLTPDATGFFGAATGVGILAGIVAVGAVVNIAPLLVLAAPLAPASLWMGARALMRRTYASRRQEAARLVSELAATAADRLR